MAPSKNSGSAPGECGSLQLEKWGPQDPHFSNDLGMVGPDFGGSPYHCYNGSTYIADFLFHTAFSPNTTQGNIELGLGVGQ